MENIGLGGASLLKDYVAQVKEEELDDLEHDLAAGFVAAGAFIKLKALDSERKIDFSRYGWELGFKAVEHLNVLRYICENSTLVEDQGFYILASAVNKGNKESVVYLIDECKVNPEGLINLAFIGDKYRKLMGENK